MKLAEHKIIKKYLPLMVLFNITDKCNLKCSYCFGKYYERKSPDLPTKKIHHIIDQLSKAGTKRLGIGGGEPLLRNDIGYIIDYLKNKNIEVGLSTNGILLPQKISELKKVDTICISLDGEEGIHDYYRGKGSYKKAMQAIECSVNNHIKTHVSTVLTKKNINSLDFLLKKAKELGFLLELSPLYNQFFGVKNQGYPESLKDAEYREIIKTILNLKKRKEPIFYSAATYESILNWEDYNKDRIIEEETDLKHVKCYAGKYFCHIESNGDVYPCVYSAGHKAINCLESNFEIAFKNINEHNCKACMWACYIEFNLLFDFNLNVLKSLSYNFLRR